MSVPKFGEKKAGETYKLRQGAYCIVFNKHQEKILLVQAPNKAFLLPGGGIETGESHIETLKREALEELGYEIVVDHFIGRADEYFYSRNRTTYFFHPGYFYDLSNWTKVAEPTEIGQNLCWMSIPEGIKALKRQSHKWAVRQWQTMKKQP